jgi:hypothetical protein
LIGPAHILKVVHLDSEDKWVALAARRALQAMFLHSSPASLGISDATYQRNLGAHYRHLLEAALGDPSSGTTAKAVLKVAAELLQTWRRRHEQEQEQRQVVLSRAVGQRLLQVLSEALGALTSVVATKVRNSFRAHSAQRLTHAYAMRSSGRKSWRCCAGSSWKR